MRLAGLRSQDQPASTAERADKAEDAGSLPQNRRKAFNLDKP